MTVLDTFAEALVKPDSATTIGLATRLPDVVVDIVGAWIAGQAVSENAPLAAHPRGPLGSSLLDRVARAVAVTRSTEIDDIHLASCTTAGAIVVPTAALLAAELDAPATRVSTAIAAGYEAMIRFDEAVNGPEILFDGLWPTYLSAPLGTAAVTAALLGLTSEQTADALALALAQISGAAGRSGARHNARFLLAGLAARTGCVSAFAAHQGFGGDRTLLDGDWLQRTHGIALDLAPIRNALAGSALGEISRKPVCAARQAVASVEAFRTILARGVDPSVIQSIRIAVPKVYQRMIAQPPVDRTGRIVSVAYLLALAAYRPDALLDVERAALADARLEAFRERVEIVADPALDAAYPQRWPARVEVTLADGRVETAQVDVARGDPGNPLSSDDIDEKFIQLVGSVLGEQQALLTRSLCRAAPSDTAALRQLAAQLAT